MKTLIDSKDYKGIKQALSDNPNLANEGISYSAVNPTKAHPLHRICDGVFSKKYTGEEAVTMAKIFFEFGAHVNGTAIPQNHDTPLIAAASLHADQLAILYIENGADINHAGTHGGTALHWAAWCGRELVLKRLIEAGAEINRTCVDFKATPLFWAVHGSKNAEKNTINNYAQCLKILMQSGADKSIPNREGLTPFNLLNKEDSELNEQLNASYTN